MIERPVARHGCRGLHRISAGANLLLLTALVTAVLASSGVWLKAATFGGVLGLAALSGMRPAAFLRSLRFVLVFTVVLFVAQVLSTNAGDVVLASPVQVTGEGLRSGAEMAFRFLSVLSSSLLFVWVTDPDRLAQTLIQSGVPYRFGYLLILALRFVPFFRAEVRTIREAQRVRGIRASVRSPRGIARSVRYTFVPVLVSALSRVDGIAMSMKGRCFGLHPRRTFSRPIRWGWADGMVSLFSGLLIGATILSRVGGWS